MRIPIPDPVYAVAASPPAMASQPPAGSSSGQTADPSEPENSVAARAHVVFPHPEPVAHQNSVPASAEEAGKKKRKKRAGKRRRNRRQSFAAPPDDTDVGGMAEERSSLVDPTTASSTARESFYRLQRVNKSSTSLESEALLDHRYFAKSPSTHISFGAFPLTSHVATMGLSKLVDKACNKAYRPDAVAYGRARFHTHPQAKAGHRD